MRVTRPRGECLSPVVRAEFSTKAKDPDELSAHAVLRGFARSDELRAGNQEHRVGCATSHAHHHQFDRYSHRNFPRWSDHSIPQLVRHTVSQFLFNNFFLINYNKISKIAKIQFSVSASTRKSRDSRTAQCET